MGHMRRRLVWLVAAVCLGGVVQAAEQEAGDPFEAMHRRDVAGNEPGRTVTIRTKDGRTSFQPREPIEIELTITPGNGVNVDTRFSGCGFQMTEVVIDPAASVSAPLTPVLCPPPGETISGGVIGGFMGGQRPWTMTFLLNGPYRIDRSGPLRLFVRSRHTHLGDGSRYETSNVLTLEILPRDGAWEADIGQAASAVLDDPTAPNERATDALRTLSTLATPAAAKALLRRLDAGGERPPLHAVFALDDRAVALGLMEEELLRPERPVDGSFVTLLAQLARASGRPDRALSHDELLERIEHYSVMRARALAAAGRLRDAIIDDVQRSTEWDGELRGPVAGALQQFPEETTAALSRLEPWRVARLLRNNPRRFNRAAFVPLLRQLCGRNSPEIADLALRYLLAAAPAEGRGRILEELALTVPRVTIETLGRLPNRTLPTLEGAWIRLLERSRSADAVTTAAQRLERFGSAAGAARVAAAWRHRHDEWPLDVDPPLFAYLARVDPRLAERTLAMAAADPARLRGADRGQALPLAIGRLEWNDTVERFALASLASPDVEVVAQAASALAAYGSAAGRPAIEAALRRLQTSWPPGKDEGTLTTEGDLAYALVSAVNWRLSGRDREIAHAACMTEMCRYHLQPPPASDTVEPIVYLSADAEAQLVTRFRLDDVELTSVPALIAKLRQYPAGTRFYFDPMQTQPRPLSYDWSERERQSLVEEVKNAAARDGIVVGRELTRVRRDQTVR